MKDGVAGTENTEKSNIRSYLLPGPDRHLSFILHPSSFILSCYNVGVRHSIFSCPKCQTVLRTSVSAQPEKIVRCSKCGYIFAGPQSSGTRSAPADEAVEEDLSGPSNWVDWRSTNNFESAQSVDDAPAQPLRRPIRIRRRRTAFFPWVPLIVGLIIALASVGLLVVLIAALWIRR